MNTDAQKKILGNRGSNSRFKNETNQTCSSLKAESSQVGGKSARRIDYLTIKNGQISKFFLTVRRGRIIHQYLHTERKGAKEDLCMHLTQICKKKYQAQHTHKMCQNKIGTKREIN